jgi:hypothetical protein
MIVAHDYTCYACERVSEFHCYESPPRVTVCPNCKIVYGLIPQGGDALYRQIGTIR